MFIPFLKLIKIFSIFTFSFLLLFFFINSHFTKKCLGLLLTPIYNKANI